MNILLINYEYPPIGAGAANATWHIAREMVALGHHAVVLTSSYKRQHGRTIEDGVVVYRVPTIRKARDHSNSVEMSAFILSASLSITAVGRREAINGCVAFFSIPGGPVALLAHLLHGIPYVVSLRGGDVPGNEPRLAAVHRLLTPLRRGVLGHATAIVANSQGLKTTSEKADPFPVTVIPNGVDTDFFRPRRPETAVRREGPFRFLFVGRFQPQKNLFHLLEQMALLAKTTTTPFELHLVGDGPERKHLLEFARSGSINDIIKWHDWCSKEQIRQHYWDANCFVNPSVYEGMPNTVLEAMACGLPTIVSAIGGNNELTVHGETGWCVSLGGSTGLPQAALTYLNDPSMALRHGAAGRVRVEGFGAWSVVSSRYVALIGDRGELQSR